MFNNTVDFSTKTEELFKKGEKRGTGQRVQRVINYYKQFFLIE